MQEHMNSSTLNPFTLTESSVVDILTPNLRTNTPVLLVAIDYNWGPPVSGRFGVDFVQLWAAAKSNIGPKTVRLLGNCGPNHTWVDDLQFQHVRDCGERQLYLLVQQGPIGRGPDPLPTEFVIKLETADGQVYYDNNNGSNYRLKPYLGRSTSAVEGQGAIRIFEGFVNYRLLGWPFPGDDVTWTTIQHAA
jgi:hypothetical protein